MWPILTAFTPFLSGTSTVGSDGVGLARAADFLAAGEVIGASGITGGLASTASNPISASAMISVRSLMLSYVNWSMRARSPRWTRIVPWRKVESSSDSLSVMTVDAATGDCFARNMVYPFLIYLLGGNMSDFYCDEVLSGKTPIQRQHETERVLAFHHTRPAYPVHIVVIPKLHIPSLVDFAPGD